MTKELVTIEFRHDGAPVFGDTVTIGIYDTLPEAIESANKAIDELAKHFEVRSGDRFKLRGLCGEPDRLHSNCCYPTDGVTYFSRITRLNYTKDLNATILGVFEANAKARATKQEYNEDEDED